MDSLTFSLSKLKFHLLKFSLDEQVQFQKLYHITRNMQSSVSPRGGKLSYKAYVPCSPRYRIKPCINSFVYIASNYGDGNAHVELFSLTACPVLTELIVVALKFGLFMFSSCF